MFFRKLPRWQLPNDGQAVGGLGAPNELQGGSGRALWGSKGAERSPPPLQKWSWRRPWEPKWSEINKLPPKLLFQNRSKTFGFCCFWRDGFAGEGMGDQRNEKAKVFRLKGDVERFSGDLRGHKVPSEEAMGGPQGPLEGPRAVRGRQQDLCQ